MKVEQNFPVKFTTVYYHKVRLLLGRRTKKKLARDIRKDS